MFLQLAVILSFENFSLAKDSNYDQGRKPQSEAKRKHAEFTASVQQSTRSSLARQ